MSKKRLALVALIIASIFWSTAGVSAKILVEDVNPFVAAFYRFFIASLIILPFFLKEKINSHDWKQLLIPSLIGSLHVPLFYLGITTTTANSTSLIFTASPIATAVLSYILIKEKSTLYKWIGIIVGLVGVFIIILTPLLEKEQTISGDFVGNLLVTAGMLSWTIYVVWSRHIREKNTFSSLTMTSWYLFFATASCFLISLLTRQEFFPPQLQQIPYISILLYTAIFLTVVTYFLFQWAIEYLSATTASFKQYIEMVFSIIFNAVFLGEKLTAGLISGGALVVTGVTVAVFGEIKKRRNMPQ